MGRGSPASLRRHYPDQVLAVGSYQPTLSARSTGLPRGPDANPKGLVPAQQTAPAWAPTCHKSQKSLDE